MKASFIPFVKLTLTSTLPFFHFMKDHGRETARALL